MQLNSDGFLRPALIQHRADEAEIDATEAARFERVCPALTLTARRTPGQKSHPILGRYVAAWQGFAVNDELRRAGSSGGVLTALSDWLVASGRAPAVQASAMSESRPTRTVPVRITTRQEALAAAGSRYAPVSNLDRADAHSPLVGKPCEVSAAYRLGGGEHDAPVLLSFFCAGTPSQHATDRLVNELGGNPSAVASLRYRGDGWPGSFKFTSDDGSSGEMSYQMSWGSRLGRELQLRCKLCVDGTGEHADISVGDYWEADANGFPVFDEALGNSVVIARTERGAEILRAAAQDGVVALAAVDLDDVARVQPLQTLRRQTLAGRLAGRRLAGKSTPRYAGYGLLSRAIVHFRANVRAAVGMFARSTGLRR